MGIVTPLCKRGAGAVLPPQTQRLVGGILRLGFLGRLAQQRANLIAVLLQGLQDGGHGLRGDVQQRANLRLPRPALLLQLRLLLAADQQSADGCAICAVIALAGNVLFATPPVLLLPQAVELRYLATDVEFVHLASGHPAFQSRAPPIS